MLNKIILMGRLTRDPELRRTESGTAVCSFSIAVDRDFKSKNGEKETDFIDIVSWRATAEFVSKYFTKGRMAVVEGRLQIRDWTDKEGGKRRSAEVIADNVYFGDSKPKDGGEEDDIPAYTGAPDSFAVPDGFTPDFGRRIRGNAILRAPNKRGRASALPHIKDKRRKQNEHCFYGSTDRRPWWRGAFLYGGGLFG